MNKQQIAKMAEESNQYSESPQKLDQLLLKNTTSVSKICAKARVEKFPDDFYAEENILFDKFCLRSVDIFRVDTIKDHIKLKTHLTKKSSKKSSQLKQKTITTLLKYKEVQDDFVLDFLKMSTLSDIPPHKIDKLRLFLLKNCKEGGAISSVNCVRQLHQPKLFALHFAALKAKLANQFVTIISDEITVMIRVFWMWLQAFVGSHSRWCCNLERMQSSNLKLGMHLSCNSCEYCIWGYCCLYNRFCGLLYKSS